jgi:glycosyltransferase involved in cell wall biosynthesis
MTIPTLLDQISINTAPGPFYEPAALGMPAPINPKVKLIAFYLPQFHPIPENDAWWGRGFTEWTNVTKALPRFVGHTQPQLPEDLGFYDLRNPDVLRKQAELARQYGIGGFCFHHYWFNGRRLLEKPLELLLANPDIDINFCINWANENWTRRWDGLEQDVLMAQAHSPEDDIAFVRSLLPIVRDPRYIRIGGRPLIMIYRPGLLPDPIGTVRRWRMEFARAGLEDPYVVMAQAFHEHDPRRFGIDAAAEFPPHKVATTPPINSSLQFLDAGFTGHVLDYEAVAEHACSEPAPPYKLFRGVAPSWDNEARKPGRGFALAHSTPAKYGAWLSAACHKAMAEAGHPDESIVFINAWNEWAEGTHLEPDRHFGHAYLRETARVLRTLDADVSAPVPAGGPPRIALISHDAYRHGAQFNALAMAKTLVTDHGVHLTILLGGPGELTADFAAVARTKLVPGDFADLDEWRRTAKDLVAAGVTAVLCNTLVSAQAIDPLREAGLRVIQLVHELPSLIQQYGLEAAARKAARHAAAVVFASTYIRDRFIEVAGPISGEVVVRPQGLYMPRLCEGERQSRRTAARRALGIADDRRVVLGAGFGDVRKGLDLWPALAQAVSVTCPEAVFLWVGNIEPSLLRWLKHDIKAAKLEDRILLPGLSANMADIYAAADAYALTSREDPFPSVAIEAMASGLPIAVFEESGGIVEFVRSAGGICVPYLDVAAMARALAELLPDPSATAAMGKSMAAVIDRDFDFARYGAALLALACPSRAVPSQAASVSVIVPNYNYARHLEQRLETIWAQTVPISEIILLDDASTDGSEAVMARLQQKSPIPLRIIRNEKNSGSVSRQWARGVSLATGDLVWIAEADDFSDPGFLAAALPAFSDPEVVMSYTESRMVDENGQVVGPNYLGYVADIDPTRWTADFRADGMQEVATALAVKNTVPNVSAAVFRREALHSVIEQHLEEMTGYRNAADWLCYVRLLARGGAIRFTARALNNHRRHANSVTIAAADQRHLQEIARMQDLAAELVPVSSETRKTAIAFRRSVAKQFGIPEEETLEYSK